MTYVAESRLLFFFALASLLVEAGCGGARDEVRTTDEIRSLEQSVEGSKVKIVFHCQEGFNGEDVSFLVSGKQIAGLNHVVTKRLTGFAGECSADVEAGTVELEIRIGDRSKRLPLDLDSNVYIGVSISKERIETIVSEKPFGYG